LLLRSFQATDQQQNMDKNNTTIAKTPLCFLRRFRLYSSG